MALSAAEEKELAQLEAEVGKKVPKTAKAPTGGLSPEEEAELAQLETEVGQASPQPQGERFPGEGLVRGSLKVLPAAGAVAGGMIGTGLGPVGIGGGAMLGAGMGKSLQNMGEGLLGDEKTKHELWTSPASEGAIEGVFTGAGGLVRKAGQLGADYIKAPITNLLSRMGAPAKEGAEEVIQAASRMGAKPTRGMLTKDQFVQKLDSSLMQTPSSAGAKAAEQMQGVYKGMQNTGESIFEGARTAQTPNQLSQGARSSMVEGINKKLQPAIDVYKSIEEQTPLISIGEVGRMRLQRNIAKLPYVKITGTPESSFANQINTNLDNIRTLDELRNLRSYVGKLANDRAVPSTMKHTAGEIYDKLSRLEQSSITRAMFDIRPKESKAIATSLVKNIRMANKTYASTSNELKELGKQAGLGKVSNYADFQRKLGDLSDEQVLQKFFKPNNAKLLGTLQKQFPEAFENMKKAKLMEIYEKSLTKGELSIPKLLNNAKNVKDPSIKKALFGDAGDSSLKDIETVYNSIPQKVGPSGTAEGIAYHGFNPLSPTSWYNELLSEVKSKALANPELFKRFKSQPKALRQFERAKAPTAADVGKRKVLESALPRGLLSPLND